MQKVNTSNYTTQGLVIYSRSLVSNVLNKMPKLDADTIELEEELLEVQRLLNEALDKIKAEN